MTLSHALIQLGGGPPPTEIRLLAFGTLRTTKGTMRFTKRSAQLILAQWAELGRDFGFDYEHDLFNPALPGKDKVASGWGKLELRADGLWCVGIAWTPGAAAKIAAKEFRYLSPALATKAGEITALANCALTNFPATLGATPLVLSARGHLPAMKIAQQMMRAFGALLASAQAGADSEDLVLKEVSVKLAAELPGHIAKIKEAHPDIEEGDPEEAQLSAVVETAKQVTGLSELAGLRGGLLALQAQAQQKTRAAGAAGQAEVAELVRKGIEVDRKIHPTERDKFLQLSAADLRAYLKVAPVIGPPPAVEVEGRVQLDGKAEDQAAQAAAEQDALNLLGLDPNDKWLQPGQGMGAPRSAR